MSRGYFCLIAAQLFTYTGGGRSSSVVVMSGTKIFIHKNFYLPYTSIFIAFLEKIEKIDKFNLFCGTLGGANLILFNHSIVFIEILTTRCKTDKNLWIGNTAD